MTSSHTPRTRSLSRRPAVAGLVAISALGLVGLGGSPALAANPGTTALTGQTAGGVVNPSDYLSVTGATSYDDPAVAPLRVVPVSTSVQLVGALRTAKPGDRIVLAAGTYTGPFSANVSGTHAHPIVVAPAAAAAVTLTATLSSPGCDATGPDADRTVSFTQGASHWVLQGLRIAGGVVVVSRNADNVQAWQSKAVNAHDWQARRSVPGAGSRDALAARTQEQFFETMLGIGIAPSRGIQLLGNTITGKGIFGRMLTESVISGNTVTDIACGTGPGIWLANYSRADVVSGNTVARVATSTASHYMQEGIRFGNGSDYNAVVGNLVRDLPANGRGITTDQDSSWNLITRNTVSAVDIAFNEQQSGWGNTWSYNDADGARVSAYSFRMEDAGLTAPSPDTSSYQTLVRCNSAVGSTTDVQAGALSGSEFSGNLVNTWSFGRMLVGYWGSAGNLWNGSSSAPSVSSPVTTAGC
ncbi:MAG: right-handed parallel beta-helix repeat-containing protein [Actinomycetota bacterium]|nr:right-handed parallel beta-helix repeat-containing protein [Actinomycetota bacterium]